VKSSLGNETNQADREYNKRGYPTRRFQCWLAVFPIC